MTKQTSFRIATYNILATSYIRPNYYPDTPMELLDERHRIPVLVQYLIDLQADVYCLQEVEHNTFQAIDAALRPMGYGRRLAKKGGLRPDGCATFFHRRRFDLVDSARLEYEEGLGQSSSGHVAQIMVLECGARRIGVANTHLKWDPAGLPPAQQYGYQEARELLSTLQAEPHRDIPWLICGDLNADPTSDAVHAFVQAGFTFTHATQHFGATCNANRKAKMIDYIFHQTSLRPHPDPLTAVGDTTPLPGSTEPSDHVPVVARFEWE